MKQLSGVNHHPRKTDTASSATPTLNFATGDQLNITALGVNAVFGAPTGTTYEGQNWTIRVKDNGTARTLGFNAVFVPIGVTLPTTTVANKYLYISGKVNKQAGTFDVLAVGQQA